ncbi:hypothetical protein Q3G72_032346 [Acer saccharum]|nr:hypothetical protein Q3G72_032346 [Acer saccharum]
MVTQKAEDASSSAPAAAAADSAFAASPSSIAKRVKASQYKTHNMEDLWKKIFFVGTELFRGGQVIPVPAVVAVVSPFPLSDKIGIASVKDVVSLKQMKMDWFPYIPLEMRAALEQLRLDRLMEYQYCLPYIYRPLLEDKLHENTVVDILFLAEPSPVSLWHELGKQPARN